MEIEINHIKKSIQSITKDGLVVIVGCGLSAAEGIPSMGELANYLLEAIPPKLHALILSDWSKIETKLKNGLDLESALSGVGKSTELHKLMTLEISKVIRESETDVIREIIRNQKKLRFSKLIGHLPIFTNGFTVITTNYDRLIEFAFESSGFRVDSMFVGGFIGKYSKEESKFTFYRGIKQNNRRVILNYSPRVSVLKPHGSLDWYLSDGKPIRCGENIDLTPLIVMPGDIKLEFGYHEPFDAHRECANNEIDKAQRYLVIGYGFNDNHLQTHLDRNLKDGKQCLVVTKYLSESTIKLFSSYPNLMTLSEKNGEDNKTIFRHGWVFFCPRRKFMGYWQFGQGGV